ncbi:hypothetical protein QBC33DRAFT_624179 [Phialemonium atrogriseum]|uniref:SMP-30/Gluconolactonase/LRE-like region domain-containing protein n=1 Tax=Phialemonium atrogriseum TaxID=1093897 RepID=A0AAJ0FFQ5_9PEZI|nr:uncharacterized protein QBC33DRAFT_624179 [Phialemonium atrogriseum]KAK1761623.1 hypothetical protein QBC33DRAFT_624179 [Phialemonium atrogriseum]
MPAGEAPEPQETPGFPPRCMIPIPVCCDMYKQLLEAAWPNPERFTQLVATSGASLRSVLSSFTMYPQKILKVVSAASLLLNAQPSTANPNCKIAHVEGEYAYLLPLPFEGNLTQDFVGGTTVQNKTVAYGLANAQTSPFVSYSKEFDDLLGAASLVAAVPEAPFPFTWAGEAGVWVPDHDQVWFVSTLYGGPTALYILFLNNNTVIKPELKATGGYGTHIPLANPAGGYYFNGTVYLALVGDEREPSSLVAVDPDTFVVTPLVNSYFGLELPPVDDVVVTYANTSQGVQRHIYFSTLDLSAFDLDVGRPAAVLPNAFWMFTPETKTLQPVIPRGDVMTPNGVAVDKGFRHLFVTDTTATAAVGGGSKWNVTGSPAIYRYDISPEDGLVSNRVLFGITREGVSDGMKVDDQGRVWTAEYEGIVVRNSVGKVIGLFNKEVILGSRNPEVEMANFALAGDTLVLLAVDKVYTVKLAETVMSADRFFLPE